MKILFHTLYDDTFSSRFRVYQYLPYWERLGHQCDVAPGAPGARLRSCERFPQFLRRWRLHLGEIARRSSAIRRSPAYDLVVIQKGFTTIDWRWWLALQQKRRVPFIFDIDDAVHLEPGLVPPWPLRPLWDGKQIVKIAAAAKAVVAGNRSLTEEMRRYSEQVVEIPTSLDLERYSYPAEERRRRAAEAQKRVVLGWSGSSSSHPLLNSVLPVIRRLHDKHPQVELRLISNTEKGIRLDALGNTPVRLTLWSPETEAADLKEIDIGLMPLADSPWMKYKCGFKALQYMAVGAVAVVSPVGANREIVQEGRTGYLASSEEEWFAVLDRLIQQPEQWAPVQTEARRLVEERFSVEKHALRWSRLFEQVAASVSSPLGNL